MIVASLFDGDGVLSFAAQTGTDGAGRIPVEVSYERT
jgi:hypothetical protein